MTYATPGNYTGIWDKLIIYPTHVTDFWFPRFLMIGLLIILIGTMLHYKMNRAFASASFIVSILTILFWLGGALQDVDLYIAIICAALGTVGLVLKRN